MRLKKKKKTLVLKLQRANDKKKNNNKTRTRRIVGRVICRHWVLRLFVNPTRFVWRFLIVFVVCVECRWVVGIPIIAVNRFGRENISSIYDVSEVVHIIALSVDRRVAMTLQRQNTPTRNFELFVLEPITGYVVQRKCFTNF